MNDGLVIGPRFKCRGSWVDSDVFMNIIFEELKNNPYSDHQFLALKLSANPNYVKTSIKDGIIKYCKDNPGLSISEVCRDLKVRTNYIQELCSEARLEVKASELGDLKTEFFDLEQEAINIQNEVNRKNSMQQLNSLYQNSNDDVSLVNNNSGFYSSLRDQKRGFGRK